MEIIYQNETQMKIQKNIANEYAGMVGSVLLGNL